MSKTADRQKWDEVMAEVTPPAAKYTLPDLLGDYRAIEGKPGWYLLPMCIEVEMRAIAFLGQVRNPDAGRAEQMRLALDMAACVLHRLDLPADPDAAADRVRAYLRGEGEIMRPANPAEIGRAFGSEALVENVLKPSGLWVDTDAEGDAKNE